MKLNTSPAIEFFTFLSTYVSEKIDKEQEEIQLPRDPRLAAIFIAVDQEISPFLKNDIELFFDKLFITQWLIFSLIHQKQIQDDESLLQALESLTDNEFRSLYLSYLKLTDKPLEQIGMKEIKDAIVGNFFHSSRPQEKMVKQLISAPAEWRTRIAAALRQFHAAHFLPRREELLAAAAERMTEARRLIERDPKQALDTLTIGHYRDLIHHAEDVTVYLAFCYDRGMMLSIKRKVILLGLTRTVLLTTADRKIQTNMFFSVLSDAKRVEILRLLGRREWFSNELAKHFGLTAATMSYHLSKMLTAGLVTFRIGDKNKLFYSLNRENLKSFLQCASADLTGEGECSQLEPARSGSENGSQPVA